MGAAQPPPSVVRAVHYHAGADEPIELDLADRDTGEVVCYGLTVDHADALVSELRVRILQARNSRPLPLRRLPYVDD